MPQDTLWFKDAIIYELHVRSFSRQHRRRDRRFSRTLREAGIFRGIGRDRPLVASFYPSPMRDDGYDIADYFSVNPSYGTLKDFQEFLAEAHRRKLRVITELVINHTSDQHRLVPAGARRASGIARPRFLCLERYPETLRRGAHHFQGFRDVELVVGSGGASAITGTAFTRISRT